MGGREAFAGNIIARAEPFPPLPPFIFVSVFPYQCVYLGEWCAYIMRERNKKQPDNVDLLVWYSKPCSASLGLNGYRSRL